MSVVISGVAPGLVIPVSGSGGGGSGDVSIISPLISGAGKPVKSAIYIGDDAVTDARQLPVTLGTSSVSVAPATGTTDFRVVPGATPLKVKPDGAAADFSVVSGVSALKVTPENGATDFRVVPGTTDLRVLPSSSSTDFRVVSGATSLSVKPDVTSEFKVVGGTTAVKVAPDQTYTVFNVQPLDVNTHFSVLPASGTTDFRVVPGTQPLKVEAATTTTSFKVQPFDSNTKFLVDPATSATEFKVVAGSAPVSVVSSGGPFAVQPASASVDFRVVNGTTPLAVTSSGSATNGEDSILTVGKTFLSAGIPSAKGDSIQFPLCTGGNGPLIYQKNTGYFNTFVPVWNSAQLGTQAECVGRRLRFDLNASHSCSTWPRFDILLWVTVATAAPTTSTSTAAVTFEPVPFYSALNATETYNYSWKYDQILVDSKVFAVVRDSIVIVITPEIFTALTVGSGKGLYVTLAYILGSGVTQTAYNNIEVYGGLRVSLL